MNKDEAIKAILMAAKGLQPQHGITAVFAINEKGQIVCIEKNTIPYDDLTLFIQICRTKEDIRRFDELTEEECLQIANGKEEEESNL